MDWLKRYFDEATFDFVGRRRTAGLISVAMVLVSWMWFGLVGPHWGIDFTGGTEVHLRFSEPVGITDVRDTLGTLGLPSDAVQEFGGTGANEFKIRINQSDFGADALRTEIRGRLERGLGADRVVRLDFNAEVGARFNFEYSGDRIPAATVAKLLEGVDGAKVEEGRDDNELVIKLPGLSTQVEETIRGAMGERAFEVLSVDAVGPKVGESLRRQGFSALLATLALILVYVAFRFDLAFAPGAVIALIHDVSVTVLLFMWLGKEFNLPMIGALLTIVGYSLNDTIVIYDRIRENRARYGRQDLAELINISINETVSRTFGTGFTTFLAIAPFLVIGSPVIADFTLAMTCGIVFGTYSTVFIASPMILEMERLRPWLSTLVALDAPAEGEEDGAIPDEFLSESEKRRRERARLGQAEDPGEE